MTRKEFLASAAGGLVAGAMGGAAPATELRVGIMSDTHVTALSNAQWFEKALRMLDVEKVDAVLISGDLFHTVREKRVFSPKFCPAEKRDTEACACDFRLSGIPTNFHGRVRFAVTPHDVWGNPGAPIFSGGINPDVMQRALGVS